MLRGNERVNTPPPVSTPMRQRSDVEQQHLVGLAGQRGALDRGAGRDDLVGVGRPWRVLPKNS